MLNLSPEAVYVLKAVAGLAADGRQIVTRAKSEATNYERLAFYSQNY
jgi:20S proteasome alpha/beta subunit